ncbi:protein containing DUF522 [Beggiatoa sp. PS]|nr:protein containing DUF522 [Beggiatoa sp. PS]
MQWWVSLRSTHPTLKINQIMTMRCIVFDISGEYAHFKKPYSPMSPVTYPFPPPTAIMGLLGAILGYSKEEYHERLGWQTLRVGIRLLKPTQIFRAAINLLQTKDGTDTFFRPKADKNSHTRVPYEFVKSPAYRIYVMQLPDNVASDLVAHLKTHRTVYTPVLGLASCLADVEWVGEWEAQPLAMQDWETYTVVPLFENININYQQANRRYHRFRVPAIMDNQRIVHCYQEVLVAEDMESIEGQGNDNLFFGVNNESIAFFPNLSASK